ncbi:MAG TPA: glycosyltransferase family 2 protein [Pelolinea sp.]|nr:glycosyltransferase family 2 protein [Pelolinea sp.]
MKPSCSIVIRAFNEERHIDRLLDGIAHQTVKDVEVILVDSGSSDCTVAIGKKMGAAIVNISPQEFTFGRSLNKGIAEAKTDFIIIASAHVYPVYPDWIEKLLEHFKEPNVALVYGKQRGSDTSQYSEQQIFSHWYGEISQNPQDHPFCNNANAAIRKNLWEAHRYDENLPGLEDLEWAKWAMEQKYKIVYSSEAEIVHVHDESWAGIHKRYLREGMAFKQIYPQERFSFGEFIRLFVNNSWSDLRESARDKKLFNVWINILRFRWLQFHGTYLGYKRSGPLTWQLKKSFYYPRGNGISSSNGNQREVEPISYSETETR